MHNVQNAMFAAAMAYAMGVKLENIRHGLRTFDTTFFQAPGRMNVFDEHPVQGDPRLRPQPGRGAGDVRPRRAARGAAGARIVRAGRAGRPPRRGHRARSRASRPGASTTTSCRRDDDPRGRGAGRGAEAAARRSCSRTGVPARADRGDPRRAGGHRARRSRMAQPGDLLLVFADNITRCWKQVIYFQPEAPARRSNGPRVAPEPARRRAAAALFEDGRRRVRAGQSAACASLAKRTTDLTFLDSRRLTGPDLLRPPRGRARESRWTTRTATARSPRGAGRRGACSTARRLDRRAARRAHLSGRREPRDQRAARCLYAATDVNEWAWEAALAEVHGPPAEDVRCRGRPPASGDRARAESPAPRASRRRPRPRAHLPEPMTISSPPDRAPAPWSGRPGSLPDPDAVDWGRVHDIPIALVTGSNGKTTVVRLQRGHGRGIRAHRRASPPPMPCRSAE